MDNKTVKRSFWQKPWGLKEGFLIGAGLIIAGLLLEASIGPVVWSVLVWPSNIILVAAFVLLIIIAHCLRKKVYLFSYLTTFKAAVPILAYAVVLTVIMGVTRQQVHGRWLNDMLSFWPFVLIYVCMSFMLGMLVLKRLSLAVHHSWKVRVKSDIPFLFNHLGFFLALVCATAGNADMQSLQMVTKVGETEWRAQDEDGNIVELPIAIELKKFIMEEYPADARGKKTPKRFASDIQILTKSGHNFLTTVDVNKPVSVEGWKIYQYGYDTEKGAESTTSIFELVKDPWIVFVYAGIFMMIAGALCMLLFMSRGNVPAVDEKTDSEDKKEGRS